MGEKELEFLNRNYRHFSEHLFFNHFNRQLIDISYNMMLTLGGLPRGKSERARDERQVSQVHEFLFIFKKLSFLIIEIKNPLTPQLFFVHSFFVPTFKTE